MIKICSFCLNFLHFLLLSSGFLDMIISRQIQLHLQRSKTTTDVFQLYSLILKTALDHNPSSISHFIITTSSISIELARSFFDNFPITPPLFAWNTIIRAYTKTSTPIESLKLFSKLRKVGLKPDNFTYPFVLKSCGCCLLFGEGGATHSIILKVGLDSDKYIVNTLLRMYAACGAIEFARHVFDEMPIRDVVSWSSMIAGYVACNCSLDAFKVFRQMKQVNERPNSVTLVSLLSACTRLLDIGIGKSVHSYIIVNQIGLDIALGTALLEMYSKCGNVEKALQVFNSMKEKNLQSWTIMISGLADHGQGEDAITLFTQLDQTGLKPDGMSFSTILSACSHLGLVDEGRKYFNEMVRFYNIRPTVEHYGCMVDMFGRAGMIKEAYEIIKSMPMEPNSVILRSFMASIKKHGQHYFIDEKLRKLILEIEPDHGANYVICSNVSSLSGCWNDAAHLRAAMKERGVKKVPGWSWVKMNDCSANDSVEEAT